MTIGEHLRFIAGRFPTNPAILAPSREPLTYSGLFDQVKATIDALNRAGYGRGDRIAFALPQGAETNVAVIALVTGCVSVPLNPAASGAEMDALLPRLRLSALITRADLYPGVVEAADRLRIPVIQLQPSRDAPAGVFSLLLKSSGRKPRTGFSMEDELSIVFPTSGTTAAPKLIPLTQSDVRAHGTRAMKYLRLSSRDRCLDLMPVFHSDAVMASILSTVFAGASSIVPETISAPDFLTWSRELNATWCTAPPPFFATLAQELQHSLEQAASLKLRILFTCGAPVSERVAESIEQIFLTPIRNSYGATECGGITLPPAEAGLRKTGSAGVAIGPEIRIVDASGNPVAGGEQGEIVVRGEGVFRGYEGDPDNNAGTFFGEWYRTGDRGYVDGDGHLFLTTRIKELINRGGEKIAPQEIEEVLCGHPSVAGAVAFPVPHPTLGEDVAAAVTVKNSSDAEQIRRFASRRLAASKLPRRLIIVPQIPTGSTGKIQRNRMASIFAHELLQAEGGIRIHNRVIVKPENATESALLTIWQSMLNRSDFGVCDDFFDLGGDSLQATVLVVRIEQILGRELPLDAWSGKATVREFAAILDADQECRRSLVPINANGTKPPLFLVFPQIPLLLLAQRLGADQPAVGLHLREKWAATGPQTIEQIAKCLVQDILEQQPEPPHLLLGWGCGGTVAYEIAQQLHAAGRTPALLVLIGTVNLTRTRSGRFWAAKLRSFFAHVVSMPPREMPAFIAARLKSMKLSVQIATAPFRPTPVRDPHREADRIMWEGARVYAPKPYPGRVVLFRAAETLDAGNDRSYGWGDVTSNMELIHLPGELCFHPSMVETIVSSIEAALTLPQCESIN